MIETEFGKANINNKGYYDIVSIKEGNFRKKLHRLIYEKQHKCCLLSNADIHHIDGDKLNNSIDNLELLSHAEHSRLHMTGENNPMYSKHHSEETKQKIRENQPDKSGENHPMYGKHIDLNIKCKISKKSTSTGLYNVHKHKNKRNKQGFEWRYQYYENRKRKYITSVNISKLEEKVKTKGLPWVVLDEEKIKLLSEEE